MKNVAYGILDGQIGTFTTLPKEETATETAASNMQIFNSNEFGQVRVIEQGNGLWFVAADVCRALEHSNVTVALERLDEDEKAKLNLGLSGGETNIVNEPGLYSLVLGSRKPEARAFKRWIVHEVMPSIRKHGAYMTPQTLLDAVKKPEGLMTLVQALAEEQQLRIVAETQRDEAQKYIEAAQPKIDFTEHVEALEGSVPMDIFAKIIAKRGIKIGRNRLFAWLRRNGYLMQSNQPYQRYADTYFKSGFAIKRQRFVPYVQVTGKGMVHIETHQN